MNLSGQVVFLLMEMIVWSSNRHLSVQLDIFARIVCMYMYVCMYVRMYVCMYVYMYVCMYIHVHMYVCIHIQI